MRRIPSKSLWLGHAGDLHDSRAVAEASIEAVLELADSEPLASFPRELIRCRFPLADGGGNPPWLLRLAAETVASLLKEGVSVLICCSGGMSRSLCVAAGGLALAEQVSLEEALAIVAANGPADVSPGLLAEVRAALR